MGSRSVILAPFPCVQAALSVLQIAKSKITTYPGARPFLVPLVLGNFVWVRRLFLASSSSLRPRGERVENPFCMRSSPPPTLIHFRTLIFFVLFEFSQRAQKKPEEERESVLSSRPEGEETRNREGNSPGECGAKVWGPFGRWGAAQ